MSLRPINPYIVGNPIKEETGFFGRQDIFRDVIQVLRQPGSNAIVLYGQRRIGKTSVLLQLEKQLAQEGEFTPVYIDLQDKAGKALPEMLYELSQHISRVTGHTIPKPADFNHADDYFHDKFLPQVAEKVASGGLVLLFDEFDVLDSPKDTQASAAFFPYLQKWMSEVQKVKFVFVIGRRPEDLSVRTMAYFKGIQSTKVSFLAGKDAEEMIRQSEKDNSIQWQPEAVQQVIELTHGHPFFTQLLCSVALEDAYETGPVSSPTVLAQNVDDAVPQALKLGANAFKWIWDGLPPAERVVVAAMAEVKDEIITQDKLIETLNQSGVRLVARELEFAPETLIDWEVLIPADGGYRFAVPLLRRWVQANRPLRRVKDELDRINPRAETLYQAGKGLYEDGKMDTAEQSVREALNNNPNHLKARLLLGQILFEKRRLAESVEIFDTAYQYDERAARAYLIQSLLALAETQEENSQIETYERVLAIDSNQPLALAKMDETWKYRQALNTLKSGQNEQARVRFWVDVIRAVPWQPRVITGITIILWISLGVLVAQWFVFGSLAGDGLLPIAKPILVAMFLSILIGIVMSLFKEHILELAFRVNNRGKPSSWQAVLPLVWLWAIPFIATLGIYWWLLTDKPVVQVLPGLPTATPSPTLTLSPTVTPIIPTLTPTLTLTSTSTSTPALTPTHTPTPAFIGYIVVSGGNLLQGPNFDHPKGSEFHQGDIVTILGKAVTIVGEKESYNWFLVRTAKGEEGWVFKDWIGFGFTMSITPTNPPTRVPPETPDSGTNPNLPSIP